MRGVTQPPAPYGQSRKPFERFDDLFAADPHPLAATALELFRVPKIEEDDVVTWLRGLVAEQAPSVFGLSYNLPPALEATLQRILLLWERAVVAARTTEGRDRVSRMVLLLEPGLPAKPYGERLAVLRGERPSDLR